MPTRPLLLVAVLATISLVGSRAIARDDPQSGTESERIDRYLDGLGLEDLRLVHLEDAVASDAKTPGLVRTLADFYASRLLTLTEPAEVEALSAKVDALLANNPEANTPALRVMRLQGDAGRAETLASKWVSDPSETGARDDARAILDRITPELDDQQAALFREIEAEQKAVDELPDGDSRSRREGALNRLVDVAGRALYFDAWSNYYLDLLSDEGEKTDSDPEGARATRAREGFLKLLGVESAADADPEMLQSTGMARAALGAALSSALLKDREATRSWFEILRSQGVSPEIRDLADYWEAWTALRAGDFEAVDRRLRDLGDRFGAEPTAGQEALAILLVRAAYSGSAVGAKRLGPPGMLALARMDRAARVRAMAEELALPTGADPVVDLVLRWAEGRERLDDATRSKAAADYRAAVSTFRTALESPAAADAPRLAAAIRYRLAWALYGASELGAAAETFAQAALELKGFDPTAATDAAWMQAVALERLAGSDTSRVASAIAALEAFARAHPEHPNAKLVPIEVRKLRGGAITVDVLADTPSSDPNFPEIGLAALRHHASAFLRARKAGDDSETAAERARYDRARAALMGLPPGRLPAAIRLEALLLDADLTLAGDSTAEAVTALDRAGPLADALPTDDRLAVGYHQARLRVARALGDPPKVAAEAHWLASNAPAGPAASGALITLARMADEAVQAADESERPRRVSEARDAYQGLVHALGTETDALLADRNALVASVRLADYEARLGNSKAAASRYDTILAAFPRDANYLRKAARAHADAGQHDRALDCWNTLVGGLPTGSDPWFEAKVGQIAALAATDPDSASEVLGQFRILYPDLGGEPWKGRIQTLEARVLDR